MPYVDRQMHLLIARQLYYILKNDEAYIACGNIYFSPKILATAIGKTTYSLKFVN